MLFSLWVGDVIRKKILLAAQDKFSRIEKRLSNTFIFNMVTNKFSQKAGNFFRYGKSEKLYEEKVQFQKILKRNCLTHINSITNQL